ncbi:hypothetical protein P700755_001152 [Psychroflexus torquis ATCC 700755]|uniref:WG repeat-containing protein n=1 Tax=Psychroflexus torquis (strain ATCC 700755 / CIP 106069 / ACAM 623) TaxID=313595 RepID=K4IE44_PSYTT|nr:WG repeat-containing protein [Psychroflexus torquis]AFU68113.1 hypothetical protein P700755_001152 [Psychroflexus torquis ATCC 700755]
MKIKITLLLLIAIPFCALAQNSEILAKSYFLKAKEFYGNGNNTEALTNLNTCLKNINGESNAKIEALYVDIFMAKQEYVKAQEHISQYFKKATEDHSDYMKMVSLFAEITESAKKERLKLFNSNPNITLVAKEENNKWGFINRDGKFIIKPQYDATIDNMEYDRAIVKIGSKYGVINSQDIKVIPIIHDTIIRDSNNFIYLNSNKYYFTNNLGKLRLSDGCLKFTQLADDFYLCHINKDDNKGGTLLHVNMNIIIKNIKSCKIYKSFDNKHHYEIKFKDKTMNSLIDENGNIKIEPTKRFISSPIAQTYKAMKDITSVAETNIFIVKDLDDSYVEPDKIYNAKTKQTITYFYTEKESKLKEIINTKRGSFIRCQKIFKNGKVGFVSDKAIITPQFNEISHSFGKYIFVTGNYGKGLVDSEGNIVIPLKYSEVKYSRSDKNIKKWFGVKQGKNVDVYDTNGKFLYESTLD